MILGLLLNNRFLEFFYECGLHKALAEKAYLNLICENSKTYNIWSYFCHIIIFWFHIFWISVFQITHKCWILNIFSKNLLFELSLDTSLRRCKRFCIPGYSEWKETDTGLYIIIFMREVWTRRQGRVRAVYSSLLSSYRNSGVNIQLYM